MLIHDRDSAVNGVLISLFYAVASGEAGRFLVLFSRRKWPGNRNMVKRVRLIIVIGTPLLGMLALANQLFGRWIGFYKQVTMGDYAFIAGLTILCSLLVVGGYEALYYMAQWKQLFMESQRLKKSNLDSQYQFLKDQVKPHFLFNSLNTLSALIVNDPVKAESFVEEMAAVYRYLLKKNSRELTTFREERIFLESYVLMLRTRFEESLIVQIEVAPCKEQYLLPPFVLQLLMENAVKHNVVSRDKPLTITIFSDDDDNLHIQNNLQPKVRQEPSDKTGLQNLRTRYRLLKKEQALRITAADGFFTVVIPLIQTNIYHN
ncbi:MAG: histidine kinase [Chitinophaga sp.]|nr:histidine kinase [Chitinophaga sp.]